MTHHVQVADEVWDVISENGHFGETFNDVLRRLLEVNDDTSPRLKGSSSNQQRCRAILKILRDAPQHQLPGVVVRSSVIESLHCTDREIGWSRQKLVMSGFVQGVDNVDRGIWKLTDKGLDEANALADAEPKEPEPVVTENNA